MVISYALSRDFKLSFWFTFWSNLTGFILFYFHDRIWNKVKWGMEDHNEAKPR